MAQHPTTDGGTDPMTDDRLAKVETVTIPFETFKKALKRNYLGDRDRWDRSFVLRLYPPFEAEMEAEYYESEQGRHYNNDWDEKPFHIKPELLILEGTDLGFRSICDPPEEWQIKRDLTDEQIEEEGGLEASMQIAWDIFWDELKTILPDRFDLGCVHGFGTYYVDIEWEFEDDD